MNFFAVGLLLSVHKGVQIFGGLPLQVFGDEEALGSLVSRRLHVVLGGYHQVGLRLRGPVP